MRQTEQWALAPIVAALLLLAAGCASAPHQVGEETVSPDWGETPYENLLVIGVYQDRTYRVSAETAFAEELKSRGIQAEASYDRIADLLSLDSEEEIGRVLANGGFDGVMSVATLDPGYDYDYGDALETRGMVYLLGGRPGAATNLGTFIAWAGSGLYSLHLGLWDAETQKPVWQVTTDSNSTGSESEDLKALADFVAGTLREKGMIRSR